MCLRLFTVLTKKCCDILVPTDFHKTVGLDFHKQFTRILQLMNTKVSYILVLIEHVPFDSITTEKPFLLMGIKLRYAKTIRGWGWGTDSTSWDIGCVRRQGYSFRAAPKLWAHSVLEAGLKTR